MDRARELAESGASDGTVVVADFQERGRGTRGRTWEAPAGTCLMFSVLLRPSCPPDRLVSLPLEIAGTVAREVGQRFGLDARLKPPNDVVVGGRKLCGVLCISHVQGEQVEWVICGIGLNTTLDASQMPGLNATSLLAEEAKPPAHETLLEWLLGALDCVRV